MLKLVIGNKNYSSWSMRAWLLLEAFDIEFEEIMVSLNHPDLDAELEKYSHSAKVPVLLDGAFAVWDSMAIAEYLTENYEPQIMPQDTKQRSLARSISAEMHSSFYPLRKEMPMNIRANRRITLTSSAQANIDYIDNLWKFYSSQSKEGWLFDSFCVADCMYAPVASRFETYNIALSKEAKTYQQKLLNHHSVIKWANDACKESEKLDCDEAGIDI
jgi:glutathione S-transferase